VHPASPAGPASLFERAVAGTKAHWFFRRYGDARADGCRKPTASLSKTNRAERRARGLAMSGIFLKINATPEPAAGEDREPWYRKVAHALINLAKVIGGNPVVDALRATLRVDGLTPHVALRMKYAGGLSMTALKATMSVLRRDRVGKVVSIADVRAYWQSLPTPEPQHYSPEAQRVLGDARC